MTHSEVKNTCPAGLPDDYMDAYREESRQLGYDEHFNRLWRYYTSVVRQFLLCPS